MVVEERSTLVVRTGIAETITTAGAMTISSTTTTEAASGQARANYDWRQSDLSVNDN